jgi:hypothetical protein
LNEVALAYDDDKWVDWWIDRADYYNSDKDGYEIYNVFR